MPLVTSNRVQEDEDRDAGVIRNTPFSAFGDQPQRGGDDSGVEVIRGSGFGRARTGGRVRSRSPRRPNSLRSSDRRPIASPERQREAGRNLVTAENRGSTPFDLIQKPPRDTAGDANALLQAPIGGLDENAVTQENTRFASVTDPISGHRVPNQADPKTREAFGRFFDTSLENSIRTLGSQTPSQRDRNADPTRAAFQNQFFRSETLADVGIGKRKSFRLRP
jgi:hypothetical protein